jgi:hypothetical protein
LGEYRDIVTALMLPIILLLYMLLLIAYLPYALIIDAYNMIRGRMKRKHLTISTKQ